VISMAVGAGLRVPHGGIFVLPIPGAFLHLFDYIALLAGTVVSALCLGVLKRPIADASAVK
jgi:fructose PTS system EIIBC or EIIC component